MKKIEKQNRNKPIELNPKTRIHNFLEVCKVFDKETAKKESNRCLLCKNPPCVKSCPVNIQIPKFIEQIKNDSLDEACNIIKQTNCFPSICGRVCPQENQCEKSCILNKLNQEPVAIGNLEKYVGDNCSIKESKIVNHLSKKPKVAIIGSGPAGLACAYEIARNGGDATVYEALHEIGGVLVYGIPLFRLPSEILNKEISLLKSLGVKFCLNTLIGKTITINELKKNYDFIFIGTGAGLPINLNIEGEMLNGVYSANEYLTRINLMGAYKNNSNTPILHGRNVIIYGGGNVAMDSARTALRMNAQSVTILYRRGIEELPARKEEIRHAKEEGVKFQFKSSINKILGQDGFVNGVECYQMEYGEIDKSGRKSVHVVENSNYKLNADMVIIAIGTIPNKVLKEYLSDIEFNEKNIIKTDMNFKTSLDNVYAGGDAITGTSTVVSAISAGIRSAKNIIEKCV